LKKYGQIDKEIVAFNYESNLEKTLKSQVSFGAIEYSQVLNGGDGLRTYSNLGIE